MEKKPFFHGQNRPGKNCFAGKKLVFATAKSQSKVLLQLQNKSEILL